MKEIVCDSALTLAMTARRETEARARKENIFSLKLRLVEDVEGMCLDALPGLYLAASYMFAIEVNVA